MINKLIGFVFLTFLAPYCFSQTVTWSSETIQPKEKNVFTGISFPGTDQSSYYINESDAGGVSINRTKRNYMKVIDKQTLSLKKEIALEEDLIADAKTYDNVRSFILNNKKFYFFIDKEEKDIFNVSGAVQNFDGKITTPLKSLQNIDISKARQFASSASPLANKWSKGEIRMHASTYINIKPSFDNKTIISAFITKSTDEDYSTLNISEWNEDLKNIVSNDYKIVFHARQNKQKTIFGKMGTSSGIHPMIWDVVKDKNGFVYVLVKSANPKNEEDAGLYSVYQFKTADPSYIKIFKKEFTKNIATVQADFFQNETGKVYVSNIGLEIEDEKDKDEHYYVNSAVIGSFNNDGTLETIFAKQLSAEMMYNFETEKEVDKKGHINSLRIKNILPAADGSTYVVWQHEWSEYKETANGGSNAYYNYDNLLVQCYGKTKKILWEKPIYKRQVQKNVLSGSYADICLFTQNDNLYIIYGDDAKNAEKQMEDKNVAQFSVVKFGVKDLAGISLITLKPNGNSTKKYLKWPADKIGFGLNVRSIKPIGNNEYIGTARKISQGAITIKSEEYAVFKLKL